ncbi:hypothetical protein J2Y03_004814 [Neobacillus niacini]|nr:hypothetical protein [Neobacillus niacini]MDR7079756.1 hypothetical protein [Neobacillus niacini]
MSLKGSIMQLFDLIIQVAKQLGIKGGDAEKIDALPLYSSQIY